MPSPSSRQRLFSTVNPTPSWVDASSALTLKYGRKSTSCIALANTPYTSLFISTHPHDAHPFGPLGALLVHADAFSVHRDVSLNSQMDLYAVLNVRREATEGEIKRAYKNLAQTFHPDKHGTTQGDGFAQISEAYEVNP